MAELKPTRPLEEIARELVEKAATWVKDGYVLHENEVLAALREAVDGERTSAVDFLRYVATDYSRDGQRETAIPWDAAAGAIADGLHLEWRARGGK